MYYPQILILVFLCSFVITYSEANSPDCEKKEKSLALLDTINDAIIKAKRFYPNCTEGNGTANVTECSEKEKSSAYLDIATKLISDTRINFPTCPEIKPQKRHEKPMDCFEVLQNGHNESGVYSIWPRSRLYTNRSLQVYCEMDTEGNGWTVLQRRGNFTPQLDFFRNWSEYKSGFGNISRDFWIGNENIFTLANQVAYQIRFDMEDANGVKGYAVYKKFWIEDEKSNYTLHISGYNGNAGDAMAFNDGMMFSTKDRTNDQHKGWSMKDPCSISRHSGWWFKGCTQANPNGIYQPGKSEDKSVFWRTWKGYECLASIEIKLGRF